MRLKHIALFAAAATVSLSTLAAPPAADIVTVTANTVQPKKVYIDPMMYKRMQGAYKLDDGRTLQITGEKRKLYADVGDGPTEIVHVGNDRFEAIGADLSVRFEDGPYPVNVFVKSGPQRQVASAQR